MIIKTLYKKIFSENIRGKILKIRKFRVSNISNYLNNTNSIPAIRDEISRLYYELLYLKILNYYNNNSSNYYHEEISFLKENNELEVFPYKNIKSLDNVICDYDHQKKLVFVLHNEKKLFFPKISTIEDATRAYRYYIEKENILGGNYSTKSPHQYLTDTFNVQEGDVVFDIGASEGLFVLDVIEKVKKVYLFEPEIKWLEPLLATFEPWKDKVVIIRKFATNVDSRNEIQIDSLITEKDLDGIFIKIDVEGYESKVLEGATKILSMKNIRIACCTYHKQHDAQEFDIFFKKNGFETEFSDGYMLFYWDRLIEQPYFRNGIIRARKN